MLLTLYNLSITPSLSSCAILPSYTGLYVCPAAPLVDVKETCAFCLGGFMILFQLQCYLASFPIYWIYILELLLAKRLVFH